MCVTARLEGGHHMKRKVSSTTSALAHEIAAVRQATAADLKKRWRALYCTEPPRRISRDLLVRALAYRIQEKSLGGLKPSTRRLLAKVAGDESAHRPMRVAPQPTLKPGTVLLREWHGTQHQVIVRADGIVFRGKPYQPGQHEAILSKELWQRVQQGLKENAARGRGTSNRSITSPLAGKLFDAEGQPL
jgi:Protein of unknown function (DUF2924)